MAKEFLTPRQVHVKSLHLAKKIYDSGYRPTHFVVLLRGGAVIANVMHEFFLHKGHEVEYIPILTSLYDDFSRRNKVTVHGLDLLPDFKPEDKLLIVDDLVDTGQTILKVVKLLTEKYPALPETRIATLFYKPGKSETGIEPEYYLYKTDKWIVFPHELKGHSPKELKEWHSEDSFGLLE